MKWLLLVLAVGAGYSVTCQLKSQELALRACALYSVVNLCSRCVLVDERTETIEIQAVVR